MHLSIPTFTICGLLAYSYPPIIIKGMRAVWMKRTILSKYILRQDLSAGFWKIGYDVLNHISDKIEFRNIPKFTTKIFSLNKYILYITKFCFAMCEMKDSIRKTVLTTFHYQCISFFPLFLYFYGKINWRKEDSWASPTEKDLHKKSSLYSYQIFFILIWLCLKTSYLNILLVERWNYRT